LPAPITKGAPSVIDKVDVRISEFALRGPVLTNPMVPFRPAKYYKYSADLREDFGVDAIVHLNARFGRPNHKIEIIDAGKKTVFEMAEIIVKLFDVDPWSLPLMRVDLVADVEGVPVSWFQANAYVSRKQFASRIEKCRDEEVQFVKMAQGLAETIYAGKRPNPVRIYNKIAELKIQHRRKEVQCERFNRRMEKMDLSPEQKYYGARYLSPFETFCRQEGIDYRPEMMVTRIESQRGSRLPKEMQTFSDLLSADEFEPFRGLKLTGAQAVVNLDAPPEGVPVRNWLASLGLKSLSEAHGSLQTARSIVFKHANGNGKRIFDTLEECTLGERPPVTIDQIHESFRQSTLPQLSRASQRVSYLHPMYDEFEPVSQGLAVGHLEEGA
jgi:hypothetical protein